MNLSPTLDSLCPHLASPFEGEELAKLPSPGADLYPQVERVLPADKARPANEFAGSTYEVHLRGLGGESTKVDFVTRSARLQSQRGHANWETLHFLWVKVSKKRAAEAALLFLKVVVRSRIPLCRLGPLLSFWPRAN